MTAAELVPWFQMASTMLAGIGIVVSVSLGVASLNNNRRERLFKIRPNLLFNIGGQVMAASVEPFETFAGKDPHDSDVQEFITALPKDFKCLVLQENFGQLFNLGQGPAISTSIWFEPQRITSDGQERWLKRSEQVKPPYTRDWNWIPATPANMAPGASATFGIAPGSVYAVAANVSSVSGKMRIECRDIDGNLLQWTQDATFFIDRLSAEKASLTVSFEPRSV